MNFCLQIQVLGHIFVFWEDIHLGMRFLDFMVSAYSSVSATVNWLPTVAPPFAFPSAVCGNCSYSTCLETFGSVSLSNFSRSGECIIAVVSHLLLWFAFTQWLIMFNIFFMCLFAIYMFLVKYLFTLFPNFLIGLVVFLLSCKSSLYILDISYVFYKYCLLICDLPFYFLSSVFQRTEVFFILIKFNLLFFSHDS